MRRVTFVAALTAALVLIPAGAALAGTLSGGCTATADSGIDTTNVLDTSRADPFDVERDGTVTYTATSPTVFKNHQWRVWVKVGGFDIVFARGGSENAGDEDRAGDTVGVSQYIADVEDNPLVDRLVGIYVVGGQINADGGAMCRGSAHVRIPGNPLSSTPGKVGTALAGLGLVGLLGSGVPKRV